MMHLALSQSGMARLHALLEVGGRLDALWSSPPADESGKLELLTALQGEFDRAATISAEELSPMLRHSLILEGQPGPFRLTVAEGTLRLQGEQALDLRLHEEDGRLVVQGRRRPAFHLYEYLTSHLGPEGQEESRIESAEGLRTRNQD